jgi:transcriptional regulator with XRE-family HTH domain
LAGLRKLKRPGWTQEQLAEQAYLNARLYQDVEDGKVDISVKYLAKICRALVKNWNEAMDDPGRMKPAQQQLASTEA